MSDDVKVFRVLINLLKLKRIPFDEMKHERLRADICQAYNLEELIIATGWKPMQQYDLKECNIEDENSENIWVFKFTKIKLKAEVVLIAYLKTRTVELSVN